MTIIPFPLNRSCCDSPGEAILTLPVAAQSFCRMRFAPASAQARAIPPAGALKWLAENLAQGASITGIELDGPGDPLADLEATLTTLELIGRQYPELKMSLTILGLQAAEHAKPLAAAGISEVTLLVDAVQEEVADKLYAWIRPTRKTLPISQATQLLVAEQARSAQAFIEAGCTVTARTTVYPGFNDAHVAEIARVMAGCGVSALQLVPCSGLADQEEQLINPPGLDLMQKLWKEASKHLQTSIVPGRENHLRVDCPSPLGACRNPADSLLKPSVQRPNLAVASLSGMEVDLHLGQAYHLLIYGPREDGLTCLLGTRPVPEPGSGGNRWQELAETLDDCFALLAASAGESPRRLLAERDITVLITDGEIEGAVDQFYGGGKRKGKG